MKKHLLCLCGFAMAVTWPGSARAALNLISVDFQSTVSQVSNPPYTPFVTMTGVEPNAVAADPVFNTANIWNVAGLTSHYDVTGSKDTNPSWLNLKNSAGIATTAGFAITGDVIGTEVIGLGQNALNSDGLFFDGTGAFDPISSNEITWQISGLGPGTPYKLFLNQLDVATWLGNPQNRAMKGFIDMNGDGVAAATETYQMDFPGALVTGTVASDGIIRGTSVRAAANRVGSTEPDWAGWQLSTDVSIAPDPLSLVVNTKTGNIKLLNTNQTTTFAIDYYEILGANALDASGWARLAGRPGFPAGNGSGNGWEDAGTPDASFLGEIYLDGPSSIQTNASIDLGNAYNEAIDARNLVFNYLVDDHLFHGAVSYVTPPGVAGDFNDNGVVDGADYALWRKHVGAPNESAINNNGNGGGIDASDYQFWRERFGNQAPGSLLGEDAVPEPGVSALALVGFTAIGGLRRRSSASM